MQDLHQNFTKNEGGGLLFGNWHLGLWSRIPAGDLVFVLGGRRLWPPTRSSKSPILDRFYKGCGSLCDAMEKGWFSIGFYYVLKCISCPFGENDMVAFQFGAGFNRGWAISNDSVFAKSQPQKKCDLTHEFKGVSKKSGNAKSAMRKPYKHNAFPILSGPFLARGS